jgi:uncharacterized membrane protein
VLPLLGGLAGIGLSWLSVAAEGWITVPEGLQYAPGTASTMLTTVVGATVGLTGFVVTVSVLVVQMAIGTFSARYMRIWYRDGILKAVLAVLVGTFTFSYALLRRVGGTHPIPNLGILLSGVFVCCALILFLVFLDRFVHRLRPVAVAALVARAGRQSIREAAASASSPARPWDDADLDRMAAAPSLVIRSGRPGAIQAVDGDGLAAFAAEHDCIVALAHAVGDFVSSGTRVIEVHGTVADPEAAERRLRGMIALGEERTIEQDPAFALRVLVDIAIRALSAAINDPTTAVQVIGHLEDTLETIGRTPGLSGRWERRDGSGRIRFLQPARSWEDFLLLGTTEVRLYGAGAIQVMRRLRAALETLRETVRPEYVAAVDEELARLEATIAANWDDTVDLDRTLTSDTQGIGGPQRIGAVVRSLETAATTTRPRPAPHDGRPESPPAGPRPAPPPDEA